MKRDQAIFKTGGLLLLAVLASAAAACIGDVDVKTMVQGEEGAVFQNPWSGFNLGYVVSGAGDVNGDGFDDFVASGGSNFNTQPVFLVFGRNASQWAATASTPPVFAFPSADPSSYVAIQPRANCHYLSYESLSFGDINGDGFSDVLLGSYQDYGCGFAVFGHSGAWDALIVAGEAPGMTFDDEYDNDGQYSIGCGDINGDGIEDVLVATYSGIPFVVFGDARISNTEHVYFRLSDLTGANGFVLTDYPVGNYFSYGYTGRAGDVNGDGIDDLLIGHGYSNAIASEAGRAYVLFGRSSWTATVSVSDAAMDGKHGFIINPPSFEDLYLGWNSRGAGDLNHDGFADIFLDTDSNAGIVIFGASTWGPTFSVEDIDGTNGFMLQGDGTTSSFGYSGGPAGDVNGDHVDDLVFGDLNAQNGAVQSGAAWVLYGRRGIWPATVSRSDITDAVGFEIIGTDTTNDNFGRSITGAGDANGDGFPDVIIGAPFRDVLISDAGEAYLIFSNAVEGCLECNETDACLHCAQGFFLETDGTCTDCSLTNTWSVNDTENCQTCVVGECLECDAGSGICTKCPVGKGPNTTAQFTCQECSSTTFSPDGARCRACLLGFGCISCNAVNGLCTECPAGMHLDGTGCEDCGDMQWSTGGSAAACSACPVDTTCEECDSRTGHCTSCPAAHGLADSGCTACGATQFSDGKHACAACELQDGCSACNRTTGMCVACPAGTGLQGVGCVACTPTKFVVDGYCSPCALDDGCIACDPVTGACVDCPGDMVPTGTGCKPFEVASNATKDEDNVSMAAKPTTNALHLIASIIISAIAAAAMAAF